MTWCPYLLAYGAFLASHIIPSRPALRQRLIAILGKRGYFLGYSLLSLGLFWGLIVAAGAAPVVTIWAQSTTARWGVNLAMPLALLLIALSVGVPNPMSFGGRAEGFDPDKPGIVGVTRHPLLIALALWSAAHLWANGDLAHIGLFGGMLVFALAGIAAIEARNRRQLGAGYEAIARHAPILPFRRGWPRGWGRGSLVRVGLALLIWVGVLHLHPVLFAASPLP